MGAWGAETFHNDSACDFAAQLAAAEDLGAVEKSISAVLDAGDDYIEVDTGSEVLAACEVLARLQGRWGLRDANSKALDAWIVAHPQTPPKELLDRAVKAIDRIRGENSELSALWDGQDDWRTAVVDLRTRVAG